MTEDLLAESDTQDATADRDSAGLQEVHERALRRFDDVSGAQAELRRQSLEARRFVTVPGAMWEGAWGKQYENAPRPEVDKITKGLEKIETDYRENRLTVDFIPAGTTGDNDTAEMLDGMHRADAYHFKAQQARDNAFQEGIRGGFGAYRLTTDYADPYDPKDDAQRVNPGMTIVDADQAVFFDPGSKNYDKADAKWAFVVAAHPREDAIERWGADKIADWPLTGFAYKYEWYTADVVRDAEYYEVEEKADTLVILTHKDSGEERRLFLSEVEARAISDQVAQGWGKKTRPIKRRRVRKYVLNGTCVLKDCGYIAGQEIPIVPFYFRRDYVDNMERWRGYVGKKMDSQRDFNSILSNLSEIDSLAPFEVPIVADEQMNPTIAQEWADGNIKRHPFRRLLPLRNEAGDIVSAGPIGKIEPPQLPPVAVARLQFSMQILSEDDQNVDEVKANVSADAMDIAATRIDAKSAIPLDNMRQTVAREGEIYLGMAREVYYEPGRKVETLSLDGKDGLATLAEPHMDENGVYRIRNDLTQGRYKVIADVQEATKTQRQKTVKESLNIATIAMQVAPDLAKAALLTAVMNQDGEGMQDMQAFARSQGIAIGLVKPSPEEAQQMQAAQEGQQPDPAAIALQAQTQKLTSEAKLSDAKAVQTLADASLKTAQAEAVGGPEKAPEVPSGLDHAGGAADVADKLAGAELKTAQAAHLREESHTHRIRRGHEIEMERRAQDLAERQPGGEA